MKVKLAAEVLSGSVSNSLIFMRDHYAESGFNDINATYSISWRIRRNFRLFEIEIAILEFIYSGLGVISASSAHELWHCTFGLSVLAVKSNVRKPWKEAVSQSDLSAKAQWVSLQRVLEVCSMAKKANSKPMQDARNTGSDDEAFSTNQGWYSLFLYSLFFIPLHLSFVPYPLFLLLFISYFLSVIFTIYPFSFIMFLFLFFSFVFSFLFFIKVMLIFSFSTLY